VYASVEAAERVWREAENTHALYGFQTFDWVSTWSGTIGATLSLHPVIIIVTAADDRPLLLLPLAIQRRGGVRFLLFLGGADYNAPLICPIFARTIDATTFRHLWRDILAKVPRTDVVSLRSLPGSIGGVTNPLIWLPGVQRVTESHGAHLPPTISEFQTGHRAKVSADSRRRRRRLAQLGTVKFVIASDEEQVRPILHDLVRQKTRRFIETGNDDRFSPAWQAFCEALAVRHPEFAQLSALRVGDTVVATHWGIVFRDRYYYLVPAFEGDDWSKYSVGRLLLEHLVEWSINQGLKVFDMTVGNEPYKRDWADHTMTLYGVDIAVTLVGKVWWLQDRARQRGAYYVRRLARIVYAHPLVAMWQHKGSV
jgi:CelD/BcsL family acetyltransferase involved in cellulose biosynthesis